MSWNIGQQGMHARFLLRLLRIFGGNAALSSPTFLFMLLKTHPRSLCAYFISHDLSKTNYWKHASINVF